MTKTIFMEKWRPESLNDVVGQEKVTKFLKEFVKNKDVPHMMFAGPPGCGKTTTAIALARELYGKDWKNYFMEMNASDERKLSDIRDKVKGSARAKIIGQDFKIIFMDEADNITRDAQNALRRIIEVNSDVCRFILSCNYPNKIIQPLIDRCVTFRFRAIKPGDMKTMLKKIVDSEGIDISNEALYLLANLSNGSMRTALNTLQKLKLGNVTNINEDTIYDTVCYVNDDHVRTLLVAVRKGDLNTVDKYMDNLLHEKSYDTIEIIESLRRLIKDSKVLKMEDKIDALTKIGEVEFRISVGASYDIQLKTYGTYLIQLYGKYEK